MIYICLELITHRLIVVVASKVGHSVQRGRCSLREVVKDMLVMNKVHTHTHENPHPVE